MTAPAAGEGESERAAAATAGAADGETSGATGSIQGAAQGSGATAPMERIGEGLGAPTSAGEGAAWVGAAAPTEGAGDGGGAAVPAEATAEAEGPGAVPEETEAPGRGAAIAMYVVCIAIPIGFFLGPLAAFIIWRARRDEPFLDFHGRQVLDLVLTAIVVGGGLYLAGRLIQQAWALVGIVVQWTALGVVLVQFLLLLWGAVTAARTQDRALPASLCVLRRGAAS